MPDEDCIQYLGTLPSMAARALSMHPFPNGPSRPVTGVSLHIEGAGADLGYSLTFRKAEQPLVQIGRRPGSLRQLGKTEENKAFFNCPVVSREHGKLVFSDSSQVYLVDTNSHHGTHVRNRADTISRKLKPDTPTLLADGDVITFGKSVGSDKGLVRPVVARVELLYGPKPLVVPAVAPANDKSLFKPLSGRYGVHASDSASSDSEDASHDSDVEEISRPSRPPWRDSNSDSASNPCKADIACLPSIPPFREYSPFAYDEYPVFSPEPQSELRPDHFYNVDPYDDDIFDDEDDNEYNSSVYSRSTSPMDLASSPEPQDAPAPINPVIEPLIIGAWPRSRSSSPSVFSSSFPPLRVMPPAVELDEPKPAVINKLIPADFVVEEEEEEEDEESEEEVIFVQTAEPNKPAESNENAEIKSSLATLKVEVAKLQAHRRKYKQRFNDNIKVMSDKFSDLEERTGEINDLYTFLSDKVEDNVDACQQAQAQIDVLQLDRFRMLDAPEKVPEPEVPSHHEVAKANAKVLEDLVTEMTELRNTARKEMAEELQSIHEAKEALRSLTDQVLVQTASLKRKRSDDEDLATPELPLKVSLPVEVEAEPPRKRVRRVAKVLAQTVTATAVGAAVCWSALAFS